MRQSLLVIPAALALLGCPGRAPTPEQDAQGDPDAGNDPMGDRQETEMTPTTCSPVAGTGCAAGQTCTLVDACGTPGCGTSGAGGQGSPCTMPADCGGRTVCLSDGLCHQFCNTDGDCAGGDRCSINVGPDPTMCPAGGQNWTVCTTPCACNVLNQTGCGLAPCTGACYELGDVGDCAQPPPSGGMTGASCCDAGGNCYVNLCAAGFTCVGASPTATCHRYCECGGSTGPCTAGTPACGASEGTCTDSNAVAPDGRRIGFCM